MNKHHQDKAYAPEDESTLDREIDQAEDELRRLTKGLIRESVEAPDPDTEWESFRGRLKRRRTFGKRTAVRAAAACALICLAVAGALLLFRPDAAPAEPAPEYAESEVVSLETSAGQSYVLGDENETALAEAGVGARLADTATIAYDADDDLAAVEYHKLTTPRAKTFRVVLSDGTAVWLNAGSVLEYPSRFTGAERAVRLEGEAYFDVARDSIRPFIVRTDEVTTRVLGTEFNVSNYEGMPPSVTLVRGSVEVSDSDGAHATRIEPGECAVMMRDGAFAVSQVNTDALRYWIQGYFYFDNEPLGSILDKVGKWYGVDVRFENPMSRRHRLHLFARRDEGVEEIVRQLNEIRKVDAVLDNGVIVVR